MFGLDRRIASLPGAISKGQRYLSTLEQPRHSSIGRQEIRQRDPVQHRAVTLQSLVHAAAYVNQLCITLRGELDHAAMLEAWRSAVARHDILRTHFEWRHGGEALQIISRSVEVPAVKPTTLMAPNHSERSSSDRSM